MKPKSPKTAIFSLPLLPISLLLTPAQMHNPHPAIYCLNPFQIEEALSSEAHSEASLATGEPSSEAGEPSSRLSLYGCGWMPACTTVTVLDRYDDDFMTVMVEAEVEVEVWVRPGDFVAGTCN